jgi:hypothetical protein
MVRPDVNENITPEGHFDKAVETSRLSALERIAPSSVAITGVYAVARGRRVEDVEGGCVKPRRDP